MKAPHSVGAIVVAERYTLLIGDIKDIHTLMRVHLDMMWFALVAINTWGLELIAMVTTRDVLIVEDCRWGK